MAITRTPIIDDNGTGTTGTVIDNAWKQEFYGQIDAALAGLAGVPWTRIPFNAADFTASGSMTWTVPSGGVNQFHYCTISAVKLGIVMFDISGTVAGTLSTTLVMRIPLTVAAGLAAGPIWQQNAGGAPGVGYGMVGVAGTALSCYKDPTFALNWAAGTARVVGMTYFQIP